MLTICVGHSGNNAAASASGSRVLVVEIDILDVSVNNNGGRAKDDGEDGIHL